MSDRDALMYLYENTQMHPAGWVKETNWDTERRSNVWYGVKVDEGAHVVDIVLSENRLMGILLETDRLKQLPALRMLFLNSNFLKGPIPACLGRVTSLGSCSALRDTFMCACAICFSVICCLISYVASRVLGGPRECAVCCRCPCVCC